VHTVGDGETLPSTKLGVSVAGDGARDPTSCGDCGASELLELVDPGRRPYRSFARGEPLSTSVRRGEVPLPAKNPLIPNGDCPNSRTGNIGGVAASCFVGVAGK